MERRGGPSAASAERRRPGRRLVATAVVGLLVVTGACSSDERSDGPEAPDRSTSTSAVTTTTVPQADTLVFSAQGDELDAYAAQPSPDGSFRHQRIPVADLSGSGGPVAGRAVGGQICPFTPEGERGVWLVVADESRTPPGAPGWSVLRIDGERIGELRAEPVARLDVALAAGGEPPLAYGCAVLADGRIVTTSVGSRAPGIDDGQLIMWFPPTDGGAATACKLDLALPGALSVLARRGSGGEEELLVATARGGVVRYHGPFPTSATPQGGCGSVDPVGVPTALVAKEQWLAGDGAHGMTSTAGLAPAPDDGVYVSSVLSGVIAEYGPDGEFRRTVLEPPPSEVLGESPFTTGSPLGLAVDAVGTLFYADPALVGPPPAPDAPDAGPRPSDGGGTVRRVRFEAGMPRPPEAMGAGLDAPDGVGVASPSAGGGGSGLLVP